MKEWVCVGGYLVGQFLSYEHEHEHDKARPYCLLVEAVPDHVINCLTFTFSKLRILSTSIDEGFLGLP